MAQQEEKTRSPDGTKTEAAGSSSGDQRFPLGRMLITPTAQSRLDVQDVYACVERHARGDWGECCDSDRQENQTALTRQRRLFSVYRDRNGVKFWIITEADRSATTVLLPEDY